MVPLLDIETEEQRELLAVVHPVGKAVVDIVAVVDITPEVVTPDVFDITPEVVTPDDRELVAVIDAEIVADDTVVAVELILGERVDDDEIQSDGDVD